MEHGVSEEGEDVRRPVNIRVSDSVQTSIHLHFHFGEAEGGVDQAATLARLWSLAGTIQPATGTPTALPSTHPTGKTG